jgi:hypothetical protein
MRQRCKGEVRVLGPGGTPVIGPGNENGPTATAFPQVSPNGKCRTAPTGPSGTYEENLTISQVPIAGPKYVEQVFSIDCRKRFTIGLDTVADLSGKSIAGQGAALPFRGPLQMCA